MKKINYFFVLMSLSLNLFAQGEVPSGESLGVKIEKLNSYKEVISQNSQNLLEFFNLKSEIEKEILNDSTDVSLDEKEKFENIILESKTEILKIPRTTMEDWLQTRPDEFSKYKFYIVDLYRMKNYTLDVSGEKVVKQFDEMNKNLDELHSKILTDLETKAGKVDYNKYRNTFAEIYNSLVQRDVTKSKIYNYPSTLKYFLEKEDLSEDIFYSMINSVKVDKNIFSDYIKFKNKYLKNNNEESGYEYTISTPAMEFFGKDYSDKMILRNNSSDLATEISNSLNQKLIFEYMLKNSQTKKERLDLISQRIEKIFSTYYRNIILSDFENRATKVVENNGTLDADKLDEILQVVMKEYYGENNFATQDVKNLWETKYFKTSFYKYEKAIAYGVSQNIYDRISNQSYSEDYRQKTLEDYCDFIKSVGTDYPVNLLLELGIDLNQDRIYSDASKELSGLIKLYEKELRKK